MTRADSRKLSCYFIPLLLLLQTSVYPVASQTNCYRGVTDLQGHPLPSPENARYLQSSQGKQVIVPEMRFDCVGAVTSWSAHTLVLTLEGFVDFLTHTITFQVWRPSADGQSYTLVGSNELRFSGTLRNNITEIPDMNATAFFSFEETIPEAEQIYFLPGDVVGWFNVPSASINKPLSPLFRAPVPTDCDTVVVDMQYADSTQQECIACNFAENSQLIASMVPLVAVTTTTLGQGNTCADSNQVCNTSMSDSTTDTPPSETTPTTTPATTSPLTGQNNASTSGITISEIVCLAIAAITLILHVILIILCAVNLAVMKQIKTAVCSKTMAISPGVRSPSAFKLGPLNHQVSKQTPADYDPVMRTEQENNLKMNHERVKEEDEFSDGESDQISMKKQSIQTRNNEEKANNNRVGIGGGPLTSAPGIGGSLTSFSKISGAGGSQTSFNQMAASRSQTSFHRMVGGGSQTSFDRQQGDSRTGSREDLLNTRPKRSMI